MIRNSAFARKIIYHKREGCVLLAWSGSGSVIQDHSEHGTSKEPMNLWPEWIRQFLWCAITRVILDHWSWSRSPQRNAPLNDLSDPALSSSLNILMRYTRFAHKLCLSLVYSTYQAVHIKVTTRKCFICILEQWWCSTQSDSSWCIWKRIHQNYEGEFNGIETI